MADQPLDFLLAAKPKSQAEQNAEILAAAPNSAEILANMQRRMNQLSSPWRQFQSDLDEMVARTAYHPEAGIAALAEKRAKESSELQNLGIALGQTSLVGSRVRDIASGFQKPSTQGTAVFAPRDNSGDSGYVFKGIPLTNME